MLTRKMIVHCDECNATLDTGARYERDARNVAWKNEWTHNIVHGRKVDLCPECNPYNPGK